MNDWRLVKGPLFRLVVAGAVSVGAVAMIWGGMMITVRATEQRTIAELATVPLTSVLYRFDPVTRSFFTVPLPLGSVPFDIAVAGGQPVEIWMTETGRDRLGRLVFTDTADYRLDEYPITSTVHSRPFHITVSGSEVWFTERGANRVGRLDAVTGQIDEFYGHGLAVDAGLSDIKVAPNGWVWIGAEQAQSLVRLVVTATADYRFTMYTDTLRPKFIVAPYSLAIASDDAIWMTAPQMPTPTLRLAQFSPFESEPAFQWPRLLPNSLPFEIITIGSEVWFSDRLRNELSQVDVGTFTIVDPRGPLTMPTSLAAESSQVFWSLLQASPPALGRLAYTVLSPSITPSVTVSSFLFPDAQLMASALAVAADGKIWISAYRAYQVYLPLASKIGGSWR